MKLKYGELNKHLDVIITITKYVQCSASCPPPGKQKVGGQNSGAALGAQACFCSLGAVISLPVSVYAVPVK